MTYKSILENMIEREARHKLQNETSKTLQFGDVVFREMNKSLKGFTVEYREYNSPSIYTAHGYVTDTGYIAIHEYKVDSGNWKIFCK